MKIGDYVLFDGLVWEVFLKHAKGRGSYQIKNLIPTGTAWANIEVKPEQVEVITKEVADVIRSVYESR